MDWDHVYKTLKWLNWVTLLVLGSASFFLMDNAFTTGVLLGGLLIMANFHALQHVIRQGFSPQDQRKRGKASIIAKYYLRLLALGILIYLCLKLNWVHPIGLVIGLSIVVISIVCLGILLIKKTLREETA